MKVYLAASVCFVILACGCSRNIVRHVPPDPSFPGTIHLDNLEGGLFKKKYRTFDITPASGLLRESRESPDLATKQPPPFATFGGGACENEPAAISADGIYTAKCRLDHVYGGLQFSIDIVTDAGRTNMVDWTHDFDLNWNLHEFGWNPTSPLLAVLVTSSVPQSGFFASILGVLGHPPPDETVHLLLVSAVTRKVTDYVIVEHSVYGFPRLLRWDDAQR
jgi:hypothetical protein